MEKPQNALVTRISPINIDSQKTPAECRLQKSLYDIASRDEISIDQFISTAIAEKLSALRTENYLKERAKRGSRLKYEAILAKVPDVEPEPYDRIPTV